jgi:hypothetical protein
MSSNDPPSDLRSSIRFQNTAQSLSHFEMDRLDVFDERGKALPISDISITEENGLEDD